MKQTNWRAMQVPPHRAGKGAQPTWDKPGEVKARYLSMGSWHARQSKGGQRVS